MWEYLTVEEPNSVALQERLISAGKDGWEAVGVASVREGRLLVILKRPSC